VISGTAMGVLDDDGPVLRSGAKPGDLVGVVGRVGWAAAGLRLLLGGETDGPLVDAHRRPQPPYQAGPALASAGASALCDVSDGLVSDLGHIAAASGVRIEVDLAVLRSLGGRGVTDDDLLNGGEDHALAFTIPAGLDPPGGAVMVGRVVAGASAVLVDGLLAKAGGYDHFARFSS
jgi:thiamine-monophosphate kinase